MNVRRLWSFATFIPKRLFDIAQCGLVKTMKNKLSIVIFSLLLCRTIASRFPV